MRKIFVSLLIILLCVSLLMTFPCKAATVWSDNFDDGNYNGWTVLNGTVSAKDHTLRSIGGAALIIYPSPVATGTWSFDILGVNDTTVGIMSNYPYPTSALSCTGLIKTRLSLSLGVVVAGSGSMAGEYDFKAGTKFSGWQHFDITRSPDGRTCIYHNGTLVIDKIVTSVTTSEYLWVYLGGSDVPFSFGPYLEGTIDNIIVSNTVDIQPPPPPFYMQTWFFASVGAVIVVIAVAAVFLLGRKK